MVKNGYVELDILNAIPHREPFLFVDRIITITNEKIIAERILRQEEFFFKGHYPQMPLMPGVLLCEAIFQTAGVFMSKNLLNKDEIQGKVPVLTRIESAKFKQMAFPGDLLQIEAQFVQKLKDFYFFKGCIKKEEKLLVSIEFILGMVKSVGL